jgi:AraC-like DNA-binding protein
MGFAVTHLHRSEELALMSYDHGGLFSRLCIVCDEQPWIKTQAELAQRLGVHRHTVATVVREQAGVSYVVWRQLRRIERGLSMLEQQPHLSIKQIAQALGFGSTSAFDRSFRRVRGLSPTDYRARIRSDLRESGGVDDKPANRQVNIFAK